MAEKIKEITCKVLMFKIPLDDFLFAIPLADNTFGGSQLPEPVFPEQATVKGLKKIYPKHNFKDIKLDYAVIRVYVKKEKK